MNPGSPEAVKAGCRCPVMDNNRGEGLIYDLPFGGRLFWVNGDCPIHGTEEQAYEQVKATSGPMDLERL